LLDRARVLRAWILSSADNALNLASAPRLLPGFLPLRTRFLPALLDCACRPTTPAADVLQRRLPPAACRCRVASCLMPFLPVACAFCLRLCRTPWIAQNAFLPRFVCLAASQRQDSAAGLLVLRCAVCLGCLLERLAVALLFRVTCGCWFNRTPVLLVSAGLVPALGRRFGFLVSGLGAFALDYASGSYWVEHSFEHS